VCVDLEGNCFECEFSAQYDGCIMETNLRLSLNNKSSSTHTVLFCTCRVCLRGDSGGKVSILGGDRVDHCEENSSYEHVCSSEWLSW
jgi:hypothetical protein